MKDEELVEAQIKEWDNLLYPQMYSVALVKDFIRKAFLAGLKAGRPKWHKVADGDLPKDDIKLAIIEIDDCGYLLCNYRNGFWYDANSGQLVQNG